MRIALKHISYDLNAQDFIFRICGNEHIPLRGSFLSTCILQSFHSGIWPDPILPASETKGEFLGINATPVTQGPLGSDMRIQSWATRYDQSDPLVVEGDPHLDRLGPSQLRAIAVMLKNRVSLVQGVRH